jgi:hypothetical protein
VYRIAPAIAALAALAGGCEASWEPDCGDGRCDSVGSRDALLEALEGHGDPVAALLREAATERGTVAGDYRTVLDGLGDHVGCSAETERSFAVLSNDDFIPKLIFARCAESPTLASRFFVAAPSLGPGGDMDPRSLHLSAWDEAAGQYRHYATVATEEGEMGVNVSPGFCMGCHGGPERLETWQPLMNELTNPWAGWNAEPGFASTLFDEYLDGDTAAGAVYGDMTAGLDSAANLEPLVRAGIARFVNARARVRLGPPEIETALELLRPMFCDETVNYVSEIHDSGELRAAALVDDGLRALIAQIDPEAPWSWVHESTVRLPAPDAGDPAVSLIPVRGESTIQIELALAARQVLEPLELLRVRAIDWKRPVASEHRCGVFRDGAERIRAGALDETIAALPAEATAAELLPPALDEILADYPRGPGGEIAALAEAGAGDPVAMTVAELAAAIESYLAGATAGRQELRALRDARACWAETLFPIAPIIPELRCD